VVDGKKQMWSSEPEEWEEIKEDDKMRLDPERIAFISSVG
jgi:hypothetical protein